MTRHWKRRLDVAAIRASYLTVLRLSVVVEAVEVTEGFSRDGNPKLRLCACSTEDWDGDWRFLRFALGV